jgi:hypothetical protein
MSKSDNSDKGCIYLLDDLKKARKKVMSAVTDNEARVHFDPELQPGISNLMQIYACATGKDYAAIEQEFAGQGYGTFKKAVGEATVEMCRPIREETERLLRDKAYLESVYRSGAEKRAASGKNERTAKRISARQITVLDRMLFMTPPSPEASGTSGGIPTGRPDSRRRRG